MRLIAFILLIFLVAVSFRVPPSIAAKTIQQEQNGVEELTTRDVLALIKAGLATEIIVAKLKRSKCVCDTSTEELQRMKAQGVPDEILLAMVSARKITHPTFTQVRIPSGTVVDIETAYRVSSQEIKVGEAISFRVVKPVKIGEVIVISQGAIATGRVVKASRGAHFGKAGRLAWTMESVTAVDGSSVPLQASGRIVGDSKAAKVATQMIITGALFWPVAPAALLFGFKRGENAYLPQGRRFQVITSIDTNVKVAGALSN